MLQDTTNREPVVTVVVVQVRIRLIIDVEVERVVDVTRIERRRPHVAVVTYVVDFTFVGVTCERNEQGFLRM